MSAEAAPFHLQAFCASDVGCKRRLNEDSYLARADIGLWVVADGMGGHAAGDFASQTICSRLDEVVQPAEPSAFLQAVAARIQVAHQELRAEAERRGGGGVIGSTVVALLAAQGHFACLWAGDSRLYLLRDGALRQVSKDHSLVQQMVDNGDLAAEEAESHPHANVVTRAVGAVDVLELERRHEPLRDGDVLLLCSDGLTGLMADREIEAVLRQSPDQAGVDQMIATALERGAPDNVTIIMVVCREGTPDALGSADRQETASGQEAHQETHVDLSPRPAAATAPQGTAPPGAVPQGNANLIPDDFDDLLESEPPAGSPPPAEMPPPVEMPPVAEAPPPMPDGRPEADAADSLDEILSGSAAVPVSTTVPDSRPTTRPDDDDPLAAILLDGPEDRKDGNTLDLAAKLGNAGPATPEAKPTKGEGGLRGFFGRLGRGGTKKS